MANEAHIPAELTSLSNRRGTLLLTDRGMPVERFERSLDRYTKKWENIGDHKMQGTCLEIYCNLSSYGRI